MHAVRVKHTSQTKQLPQIAISIPGQRAQKRWGEKGRPGV
jgi:hypothetical protein